LNCWLWIMLLAYSRMIFSISARVNSIFMFTLR
jgi:hypothetical protein